MPMRVGLLGRAWVGLLEHVGAASVGEAGVGLLGHIGQMRSRSGGRAVYAFR